MALEGSDLFGRMAELSQTGSGTAVMFGGIIVIVLLLLAALNRRIILLAIFVVALMFSGHPLEALDAGSTLLRWTVMVFLGGTLVFGISNPGLPAILLSLFSIMAIMGAFNVPIPSYGIQRAGLMLVMTGPMAVAVANTIQTRDDIRRIITLFVIAAIAYIIMSLIALPSIREAGRFGGMAGGESAPLYVLTGGALLPFVLFFSLRAKNSRRILGLFLTISIFGFLLLSGQRTGTFAGMIACIPLLSRFGIRRMMKSILILILLTGVCLLIVSILPRQSEFITERFFSTDLTERDIDYHRGLELALNNPFTGMGFGSQTFHNAYLFAWVTAGPIGLGLFSLAYIVLAGQSIVLFFKARDDETRDMARLFIGFSLGFIAAGFFEGAICSPSNVASTSCVLISIMSTRLLRISREEAAYLEEMYNMPEDLNPKLQCNEFPNCYVV